MGENSDLEGIKSGPSDIQEFIRFINRSRRIIGIFWINYAGLPAFYKILRPLEELDVDTYVGHPWICVDIKTKERLLADGTKIYYPGPGFKNRTNKDVQISRLEIKISAPLQDLKRIAYMQLVKLLKKEEDVDFLDLPSTLQNELKKLIQQENQFSRSTNAIGNERP